MSKELLTALKELEKERGIPKEALLDALQTALCTAYKKNFGSAQNVKIDFNEHNGQVKIYAQKRVVHELSNPLEEITLADAQQININYQVEDLVNVEVTPSDFGRIAAQTAKQVVVQKLREVERNMVFDEFSEREGEIVNGFVQRVESKVVIVDLGRTEGVMLPSDLLPHEYYEVGKRLKGYIYDVKNTTKGPNIFISRSHPLFLKRLFELEVPEIYEGKVEIVSIAREPGSRSKISVRARDESIDAVGACVGPRNIRVQNIVAELNGEKIDIIKYESDMALFIANALSPAQVLSVNLSEEEKIAMVLVTPEHLSLAIGKEGQNVRLAARLTGWKVDINSTDTLLEDFSDVEEA